MAKIPTPNDNRSRVKNPKDVTFVADAKNRKKQAEENLKEKD